MMTFRAYRPSSDPTRTICSHRESVDLRDGSSSAPRRPSYLIREGKRAVDVQPVVSLQLQQRVSQKLLEEQREVKGQGDEMAEEEHDQRWESVLMLRRKE